MSIKKQYLKNNAVCKITFILRDKVKGFENVRIAGDFNNWDRNCEPMKMLKSGGFSQSINFDAGKSYQFKYLINDSLWANEQDSDQMITNGLGPNDYNSVLIL